MSLCFFLGILYRSASLYHPQRRAILHLKNQRKKVKEKKTHIQTPKPPFLDFSPFRSSTVRMFIILTSIASLGIYSPIFFMVRTKNGVVLANRRAAAQREPIVTFHFTVYSSPCTARRRDTICRTWCCYRLV